MIPIFPPTLQRFKQNTLSIFRCVEAFHRAYPVLGGNRYLSVGQRCLDEMSLYQQVWSPAYLPAERHGGFGVMNFDGEWNDARQSLFAPIFLEYYKVTGKREYFERGVAALRASFAMLYCPENERVRKEYERRHPFFGPESYGFMMENIYHTGPGDEPIGVFTIYTWGNGAALSTAALVRDLYRHQTESRMRIDGCTARVIGEDVQVKDHYDRDSLTTVYDTGERRVVELRDGQGKAPLKP